MRLRQLVKCFRKNLGLTQTELGDILAVTKNYVYMIEKGKASPSKKVVFRFADLVGMNKKYILNLLISDKMNLLERRMLE